MKCPSQRPLLVAAGRYGDQAGPEGQGDGSFAKRDLQRWVTAELRFREWSGRGAVAPVPLIAEEPVGYSPGG